MTDSDLTLLYYTANAIQDSAAQKVRDNLLKVTENKYPIISVSQKPINFGKNICVGEIGKSKYNCYKQILTGVREVETRYVACAEDDTLYTKEHFEYRPPDDIFVYESNYWFAQINKDFYWRIGDISKRSGMWGCITKTETLLKNLTKRFEIYPTNPWADGAKPKILWGEPGYNDQIYGMQNKRTVIESEKPCVIFIHEVAMGFKQLLGHRRRYGNPLPEDVCYELEGFGNIKELWKEYWE
jgi:hypothetical protein